MQIWMCQIQSDMNQNANPHFTFSIGCVFQWGSPCLGISLSQLHTGRIRLDFTLICISPLMLCNFQTVIFVLCIISIRVSIQCIRAHFWENTHRLSMFEKCSSIIICLILIIYQPVESDGICRTPEHLWLASKTWNVTEETMAGGSKAGFSTHQKALLSIQSLWLVFLTLHLASQPQSNWQLWHCQYFQWYFK